MAPAQQLTVFSQPELPVLAEYRSVQPLGPLHDGLWVGVH